MVYEYITDPLARINVGRNVLGIHGDTAAYVEGPNAVPQPWLAKRDGVPNGRVDTFQASSAHLGNTREIAVYTPPGYRAGAQYPFIVLFDKEYTPQDVYTTLLDNLIADGAIPPAVLIMVSNIDVAHRFAELPHNPDFSRFIAEELVPMVRARYSITRDPGKAVVSGCSFGGIGSTSVAMMYPDVFGNVLSQSGSYWWVPGVNLERTSPVQKDRELQYRELGWLPRQFATGKKLPLKFFLDQGTEEAGTLFLANRQFRDILRARGYQVFYREHVGAHCNVGATSMWPIGLIALLGTGKGQAALDGMLSH